MRLLNVAISEEYNEETPLTLLGAEFNSSLDIVRNIARLAWSSDYC